MKQNSIWKNVYLLSLVPLLSIVLYLGMMVGGLVEELYLWAVVILIAMSGIWGFVGFLFARSRVTLFHSLWIGNLIPITTTVAYFALYIICKFTESASLLDTASLIGGLGTGVFGVVGVIFFTLAPFSLELLQILISFIFQILVFVVGYSIGASRTKKTSVKKIGKKK